ncbi:MAG: PAS domain S-box protein [Deferribacteres bacterium]|nr:PAS domain S-box protein [Deferribacteres bacterium]
MKRRIFRRTFIIYSVILLISVVFIEFYITGVVRANYLETLRKNLSIQAALISKNIPFSTPGALDGLCRMIKAETGARVTVIDGSGRVLGDSDNDSSLMDNHAGRPEIQQALTSQTGWSIRRSKTLRYQLLYVAEKVVRDGRLAGFVRLAVPLNDINKSVNLLRLKINLAVILILLTSGSLLIWQTERIRKLLSRITDYAGALSHGLFKKRLYLEGAGEFTELAHDLNNMASELQKSLEKRDEETTRLNTILKNIPDALLLVNIHGTVELSNNVAREIFGVSAIDGRPVIEIVRSPDFLSLIDRVKQERLPGSAWVVIDSPEERHLFVRVSPLFYNVGELAGVVAVFHDATHLKKLEQMRRDFVANVSHEMKTPVTAIRGFAETLLDGAMYDRTNAEKFLSTIKSHSERLNRLVDDLLTLSSIELGAVKMEKTMVNLSGVIDNVIATFLVQAAQKDIALKKNLKSGEAEIHADRDMLERILINLVDNAVKFTEKGEIEIGVAEDGGRRCIFVKDTGIGIPGRYIPRLGERFFRVDPSRSRELGGTGLGLAIVKHLVKAHGWEMKIDSEAGRGTVV